MISKIVELSVYVDGAYRRIQVDVDVDELKVAEQLALKALKSKGRKSRIAKGAVLVTYRGRV